MKPRVSKARAEKATKPLKRGDIALLKGIPRGFSNLLSLRIKMGPSWMNTMKLPNFFKLGKFL